MKNAILPLLQFLYCIVNVDKSKSNHVKVARMHHPHYVLYIVTFVELVLAPPVRYHVSGKEEMVSSASADLGTM